MPAAILVFVLGIGSGAPLEADIVVPDLARVVALDDDAIAVLHDGYRRSATFRRLVDAFETSRWRVFIQSGPCPVAGTVGCLLHAIGTINGEPALYIRVMAHARHLNLKVATMGHELQHATEVAGAGVVDVPTMRDLFARIGYEHGGLGAGLAFETAAAEHVSDVVLHELMNPVSAEAADAAPIR